MERQELEYKFEQLMRERHKWYIYPFKYVSSVHHIMKIKIKDFQIILEKKSVYKIINFRSK